MRHGVTLATSEGSADARAKNVSDGGLLVNLRRAVPVGSQISLLIHSPDASTVGLRGEVIHVERVPGEEEPAFDVGVRFLDTHGDAEPPAHPDA